MRPQQATLPSHQQEHTASDERGERVDYLRQDKVPPASTLPIAQPATPASMYRMMLTPNPRSSVTEPPVRCSRQASSVIEPCQP